MKTIINNIKNAQIKIKNKKKIINYINNYGYYRLITCYGGFLKSIMKRINTNEIIGIFEFDRILSNRMADFILDFEKRLNTIAIDEVCRTNNLSDDYVLVMTDNPAYSNLRNKGYATFNKEIYENVKSCSLLNQYNDQEQIPLKHLCLSWTFHTLVNFMNLQNDETKKNISFHFKLSSNFDDFISVCHSIRKFRNLISHNDMFIVTKINYYRREFNTALNTLDKTNKSIETDIDVKKLIKILSHFLNTNIQKEMNKIIKQCKLSSKMKKALLNFMGY